MRVERLCPGLSLALFPGLSLALYLLLCFILCLVSADLRIAFPCHRAVEQVHSPEDSIGAKTPADFQHGPLDPSFSLQGIIVRKEIHLECP